MSLLGFLPWDYAVRNLWRRPSRTLLTLMALTVVVLLVMVIVGLVRGLEKSLATSGDPEVVLVYSLGAEMNMEASAIAASTPGLLTANMSSIRQHLGQVCVSPELYLGTIIRTVDRVDGGLGLIRGVTDAAPLVRRQVMIIDGQWPGPGEVIIGRLVAAKLDCDPEALAIGSEVEIEGVKWKISGHFTANGGAFDAEVWCRLADLQQVLKRQDLSLVACLLKPNTPPTAIDVFCKQRIDLALKAIAEPVYFKSLQTYYQPLRWLAWMVAALVSGSGIFAGLNLMYGAVAGRVRELATLQSIGFRRRAILWSLLQEGGLLAAAASVLAGGLATLLFHGTAVRFTMGAFALQIDAVAIVSGCVVGLSVGVLGAMPPAWKILRVPVVLGLKWSL
ncbi:MAG: ABC transporter permease [Planctomycetaceae bacterium]|nr:ABC transporter permease [Planctomycetaceae bacterium]